ncbi:MAG TPA: zinc ribbon domain-containing protein [Terriglobia bacterium]|nr:zinc ribbon domain-containing protein [Terriglobia bacterium]
MGNFFDKVKQGVGKGVTTVSVKSKEMLETSKLKSQIADIQKQKREALEELGNIVYIMHLKSAFDEERLHIKSASIAALEEQIRAKEAELAETHAKAQEALGRPKPVGVCACGAEIHEGTKFCGKCGKARDTVSS